MPVLIDPSVHREVDAYVEHLIAALDDDLMAFDAPDFEDREQRDPDF